VFAPLVILVLWMGIYPKTFLDVVSPSVENIIRDHEAAMENATLMDWSGLWRMASLGIDRLMAAL
jgi:NADH-quinone oxidoreductase subunit M